MTREERLAIEERAKKFAKKTEKDGYLMPRPLELIDAYRQGATDQDPISRAEQKKVDIEKAWNLMKEYHFPSKLLFEKAMEE